MHRRRSFLAALFFLIAAAPCFGLMMLAIVTKEQANKLGLEIRVTPSGPDVVRIELEFEPKGELKAFERVDLIFVGADGKHLSHSTLALEKTKPGRVVVGFSVARTSLDKCTARIVTGDPGNFVGHDLRMKDFVDLAKIP